MSTDQVATAERSIEFTTAEFAVLAGLLGHRLRVPLDDLATASSRERHVLAQTAAESLAARHALVVVDGRPSVPASVARIVEIVCRPALRADLVVTTMPDGASRHGIVRAVPEAAVELRRQSGGYRCTPFATVDLARRIALLAALSHAVDGGAAPGAPMTLSYGVLVEARRAGVQGDTASAVSALLRGGVDEVDAGPFGRALCGAHSVSHVQVRFSQRDARFEGGEVSWLSAGGVRWMLPSLGSPFARLRSAGRATDLSDTPVTVTPIAHGELERLVASFLPTPASA